MSNLLDGKELMDKSVTREKLADEVVHGFIPITGNSGNPVAGYLELEVGTHYQGSCYIYRNPGNDNLVFENQASYLANMVFLTSGKMLLNTKQIATVENRFNGNLRDKPLSATCGPLNFTLTKVTDSTTSLIVRNVVYPPEAVVDLMTKVLRNGLYETTSYDNYAFPHGIETEIITNIGTHSDQWIEVIQRYNNFIYRISLFISQNGEKADLWFKNVGEY